MNARKAINYITLVTFFVMTMSLAFHSVMSHGDQLTKQQNLASHQDHHNCHHSDQASDQHVDKDHNDNNCCKKNCDCSISGCASLSKIFMNSPVNYNQSNSPSSWYEIVNITAQSYIPDQLRRPPKA